MCHVTLSRLGSTQSKTHSNTYLCPPSPCVSAEDHKPKKKRVCVSQHSWSPQDVWTGPQLSQLLSLCDLLLRHRPQGDPCSAPVEVEVLQLTPTEVEFLCVGATTLRDSLWRVREWTLCVHQPPAQMHLRQRDSGAVAWDAVQGVVQWVEEILLRDHRLLFDYDSLVQRVVQEGICLVSRYGEFEEAELRENVKVAPSLVVPRLEYLRSLTIAQRRPVCACRPSLSKIPARSL